VNEPNALRELIAMGVWILEATGVLFVAWLVSLLFQKNAARRHLTWLTAFVVLLTMPAIATFMPARFHVDIPMIKMMQRLSVVQEPQRSTMAAVNGIAFEANDSSAPPTPTALHAASPTVPMSSVGVARLYRNAGMALCALRCLWLAGVAFNGLQILGGLYRLGRMRRSSLPFVHAEVDLAGLAARAGVKRTWELRFSAAPVPAAALTWGWMRPVVLLPSDYANWPLERLEAVLLHELAHVRRSDSLSQMLALCVCALYWWHPAAWLCASAMRAAAEGAADDAVLCAGVKPSDYAAELLQFAAQLGPQITSFARVGVSIIIHSKIEARIKSIVDPSIRRRGVTPSDALRAAGIGSSMLLALSVLRPSELTPHLARTAFISASRTQRVSLADVQTQANLRAMAFEDMRRGFGNAQGAGAASEGDTRKRTAEIVEAAHDPATAARTIAEIDAEAADHEH
jgi:beta-lactamase regulating signal transducer with metallopeptidase domain